MGKKVLRNLRIGEISGVDRPAQNPARHLITKRADDPPEPEEETMHPKVKAAIEKLYQGGNQPTEAELSAAIAKAMEEIEPGSGDEAIKKELEVAKAVAGMTDAQKAYYNDLDKNEQAAFRALPSSDRDLLVNKAKDSDETLTLANGTVIQKSVVGDAQFAAFKAQQEELQKSRDESFTKRAEEEYPNIGGEQAEKGAVLKYLDAAPAAVKKTAFEMLKSGNDALGQIKEIGTTEVPGEDDDDTVLKVLQTQYQQT